MTLLAIDGLSLSIHGTPILRDLSFSIEAGEILGVIGESGSGKSLTALSIMQLLPGGSQSRGRVLFAGQDLAAAAERDLCAVRGRDLGMVFQEPMTALNPLQTIGQQVAETIRIHDGASPQQALERAEAVLAQCELPAAQVPLSRYPHQLSGGQRQRVVIAMAIAMRPRLLIADEPTTALDVTTQAEILSLLQRLVAEEGMALMLITHDLAVAASLADRIMVMHAGKVVEQAPTATLLKEREHPHTQALFDATNHRTSRPVRPAVSATPSSAEGPLLRVQDVVQEYRLPRPHPLTGSRVRRAVDGVNFEIERGSCLALVGESGSGKSTLARAILGLEPIREGQIALGGRDIFADGGARAGMQAVFQDPYGSFNPRWRVSRLITEPFFRLGRAARDEEVDEALVSVGLAPADKNKHIHAFSGGQRQRLALARALITRPELIILDEAVSALDVSVRAQILDLLAQLAAEFGLTYLFITHDLSVVRAIADDVAVMQAGKIVERGRTDAVFAGPESAYTARLLAAAPRLTDMG